MPSQNTSSFHARPGQPLYEHLEGVAKNTETLLAGSGSTAYGDDWQTVGQAIAWTHDAGKLTSWFQSYLSEGDRSVAPTPEHTYHGFVSSLLTAHVLHELDISHYARKAGFYAVANHHGVIPNLPTADQDYEVSLRRTRAENRFEIAEAQLKNIDKGAESEADELLTEASEGVVSWEEIPIQSPEAYEALITTPEPSNDRFYETVLRAWSTLVCADKLNASRITVPETTQRPSIQRLEEHISQFPVGESKLKRELNRLRSTAQDEAKYRLQDAYGSGERLFRITLPTGFGKTLTGLRAALGLAQDIDGRVIYSLPYTSIIDQVDTQCRSIFQVSPNDREYTIHHHLADTWTRVDSQAGEETVNDGSESLYAETWQSGLVLTTFVQLFESIAGPGNRQSMKLPALQDSVIIVDEPQALSLRWWSMVGRLADFLSREFDATLVLMTATQPEILERDSKLSEPSRLTTCFDDCVSFLKENPRVNFSLHESINKYLNSPNESPLPLNEAAEILQDEAVGRSLSSTLTVVNTIESAARLTELLLESDEGQNESSLHLADRLLTFYRETDIDPAADASKYAGRYLEYLAESEDIEDTPYLVATLTTRLRPIDRSLLLKALRLLLDDEWSTPFDSIPLLTVSTQLIEAGVNISFDKLYRDFAPVPSIVQAAGRCNRSFDGQSGTVTLWRLASPRPEGNPPSDIIYGSRSLLRPTRCALEELVNNDEESIPEATMISEGVSNYYNELHNQHRTADRRSQLVTDFDAGRGDQLRQASLIEEEYQTREIAVLVSAADKACYSEYKEKQGAGAWSDAEEVFDRLKPLFISIQNDERASDGDEPFIPVDTDDCSVEYEQQTGRGVLFD